MIATSGDKLRIPAEEAQRLNVDPAKQNDMMDERFKYFHFPRTFRKDEVVEVDPCARCCADWLSDDTLQPVAMQTAAAQSSSSSAAAAAAPWPNMLQVSPPMIANQPQGSGAAFVALLERLQGLHANGALTDVEFAAAKNKLLQLG